MEFGFLTARAEGFTESCRAQPRTNWPSRGVAPSRGAFTCGVGKLVTWKSEVISFFEFVGGPLGWCLWKCSLVAFILKFGVTFNTEKNQSVIYTKFNMIFLRFPFSIKFSDLTEACTFLLTVTLNREKYQSVISIKSNEILLRFQIPITFTKSHVISQRFPPSITFNLA